MKEFGWFVILMIGLAMSIDCQERSHDAGIDVEICISLDGKDVSHLDSLRMLVMFRKTNQEEWIELPIEKSNITSPIQLKIPEPGIVSVQIATSDPTIIAHDSEVEFFVIEVGKTKTVLNTEVSVRPQINKPMRIPIRLKRVSAVKLCVPANLESGAVQLTNSSNARGRALVYSFAKRGMLENRWLGGIEPGSWDIVYLDEEDRVHLRNQVLTVNGEKKVVDCK